MIEEKLFNTVFFDHLIAEDASLSYTKRSKIKNKKYK